MKSFLSGVGVAWGVTCLSSAGSLFALAPPQSESPAKLGACTRQIDGLREPTGVAFAPDGSLYVAESLARQVRVIDKDGKTVRTYGDGKLGDPRDVAICPDGRCVIADAGMRGLIVFEPSGKGSVLETQLSKGGHSAPEGIDVQGELVAAAYPLEDRVVVLKLDGGFVNVLGGSGDDDGMLNHPSDVAFAKDGSLFVADMFHQRVQCFSKAGKFVRAFGSPGPNPGQLAFPSGIAVHGDFVHVVDRDNSRVQIFTTKGELDSWYGIHALRPREGQGKVHYPLRVALNADGTRA
ncbi:MAG TPA: NHL repeat-containing protein, partial [Planctomycetota bacterium]|nr:NHL repeat-containing protein [Planctomycetota bacterium]